jgi:hypothetical protein
LCTFCTIFVQKNAFVFEAVNILGYEENGVHVCNVCCIFTNDEKMTDFLDLES